MAVIDPPKETPFFSDAIAVNRGVGRELNVEGGQYVSRVWIRWFLSLARAEAQLRTPSVVALPSDFGLGQAGQEYFIADYHHGLLWDGAKWVWGPNEIGSGWYALFETDPEGFGEKAWAECNGQATDHLLSDGTIASITLPNLTTPVYVKAGRETLPVSGPSGSIDSVGVTVNPKSISPSEIQITPVASGTGVIQNISDPHDHSSDPHTHGVGDLELRNRQFKMWFRR